MTIQPTLVMLAMLIGLGNERVPLSPVQPSSAQFSPVQPSSAQFSPVQQSDVARFFQNARQLPAAGRAIGHSVADSVVALLGIVWHDVIHGHFDRIGADITQRVSPVATALGPFCRQLAATVSAQQQLTGDLPRFAPYAVLKPSSSRRCEAHTVS
ncbi:hypothetical protein V5738_15295 [Salinisphaera sp. SPP-AMP-43]|uniref:hypothetical protein n=1 Tax=Salinisphaera sp. SPP-AMP-43 TaxID=3121288 RepID=UPI003C6E133B